MRIASGTTDQVIFFVAVDSTDLKTRETGRTTFTVYRKRDVNAVAAMTTPTVAELDATNMPGVYSLLLDEDMTIGAGNDTEAMVFHITQADIAPVTIEIELYRPKITAGNTLDVTATGAAGVDWANVENPTTVVGLSGTTVKTATDVETDTAVIGALGAGLTALATQASVDAIKAETALIVADTNELQVDDYPTSIAAIKAETALIVADTNELQVDDYPASIAAIQADTDNIQTRIPAALVGGRIDADVGAKTGNVALSAQEKLDVNTEADAAFATYDPPTKTEMDAGHALLATPAQVATELGTYDAPTMAEMDTAHALLATPAQVNAEVVDALATDTYAEPTGVPAATDDLATKIGTIYMALRNKVTVTATKKTFFDDGDVAGWEKDLSDDATTYTETEANAI